MSSGRIPSTIAALSRRKGGAGKVSGLRVTSRLVGQCQRIEHGCSGHVTAATEVLKVPVVRLLAGWRRDVEEIRLAVVAVGERWRRIRCSTLTAAATPRGQVHIALDGDGVAKRGPYRVPATAPRRILGVWIVGRINGYHICGGGGVWLRVVLIACS